MFTALAGMYMAAKVQFMQTKANITRRQDKQVSEIIYKNKIDKLDEKEKYKKSKLPESGYMTLEEYEEKSRALSRKNISDKVLDKADMPKDKNFVYVPQYIFKLVKYNDPAGSPELTLPRRLEFDRQVNAQGIVSGDFTKLVYPAVYYYADGDCVSCDLFMIKLDPKLSDLDKVKKANIVNKEPNPLLSTSKDIDRKFVFRTLTPIDFSADSSKLLIKEKIGYRHDGIWKTDLWVYDFDKKEAKNLTSVREAISYYWKNSKGVELNDNRWDIYPMGFDANNDNRVILSAYAYTGAKPMFLGIWSVDVGNESSKLESLDGAGVPISVVGYKLATEHEIVPMSQLEFEAKQARKEIKKEAKIKRTEAKKISHQELIEYRHKIHQMDMNTLMKVRERQNYLKTNNKKTKDGVTDNLGVSEENNDNSEKE